MEKTEIKKNVTVNCEMIVAVYGTTLSKITDAEKKHLNDDELANRVCSACQERDLRGADDADPKRESHVVGMISMLYFAGGFGSYLNMRIEHF